jgi:3-hydroxyacyl-[acyl-carrier-protein] dehydratase
VTLDHAEVLALLPVGHPMVLVDRAVSLSPGVAIETVTAVSGSEPCYQGLAAGLPAARYAYPRSLLLESFGQSAALLWFCSASRDLDAVPMVGRLRNCQFHGDAQPGDVVHHVVQVDDMVDDTAFMSGYSSVGGRRLLTVGSLIAVRRSLGDVLSRHGDES